MKRFQSDLFFGGGRRVPSLKRLWGVYGHHRLGRISRLEVLTGALLFPMRLFVTDVDAPLAITFQRDNEPADSPELLARPDEVDSVDV